ncbi:CHAP domain-containing protein [Candidatus Saccharibacteria bacterium]|nr:CHAP domain-containing protein [Candidatus Saccharibacteria bacterium]
MVWSMLVIVPAGVSARTSAEIQQELNAVNQQIVDLQHQLHALSGQRQTLERDVAILYNEILMLEAQIALSEAELERLENEIADAEERIDRNLTFMADGLVSIFLSESMSPLERLFGSANIGDFVDSETQMRMMSSHLATSVSEVRADREQMVKDQYEMERIKAEQVLQRNGVQMRRNQQAQLLAETRGQEAEFQRMNQQANANRARLQEEFYAAIMREAGNGQNNSTRPPGTRTFRNFSGLQGCINFPASATGTVQWPGTAARAYSYGCNHASFATHSWATVDMWQLYNRECVSFAAHRIYHGFNRDVRGFAGAGNAKMWPDTAPRIMGAVANNVPAVGAAAIWGYNDPTSQFGHVMVVEAIRSDGWVLVSQFNFIVNGRRGEYSTMEIPADSAVFVHFRSR